MLEEGIDTTLQNVSTDKGILKKTSAVQKRIPELTNEIIKKKNLKISCTANQSTSRLKRWFTGWEKILPTTYQI